MEVSPDIINQKRKEIEGLSQLHGLEEWQQDRLLQEVLRRQAMGYSANVLEIAKEWGWLGSETSDINEIVDTPGGIQNPLQQENLTTESTTAITQEQENKPELIPTESQASSEFSQPNFPAENLQNSEIQTPYENKIEAHNPAQELSPTNQALTEQIPQVPQVPPQNIEIQPQNAGNVNSLELKPSNGYIEQMREDMVEEAMQKGPITDSGPWIATKLIKQIGKIIGIS